MRTFESPHRFFLDPLEPGGVKLPVIYGLAAVSRRSWETYWRQSGVTVASAEEVAEEEVALAATPAARKLLLVGC